MCSIGVCDMIWFFVVGLLFIEVSMLVMIEFGLIVLIWILC